MKSYRRYLTALLLICLILCPAAISKSRESRFSNSFYPAQKDLLTRTIKDFLEAAPLVNQDKDLIALLVPHAGYGFSGSVAGHAYKQLAGRKYDNVIIIGSSHYKIFDGAALCSFGRFKTPLGNVKVNKNIVDQLLKNGKNFAVDDNAHEAEHSIEIQLPFLLASLKGDFKIVPILLGNASIRNSLLLEDALLKIIDDKTLVIISTDLSHYYDYDTANRMDAKGLKHIGEGNIELYINSLSVEKTEACAAPAVIAGMMLARSLGANNIKLLKHANSGDTTKDKTRVVGYASVAFFREESVLSPFDRKLMLSIARDSLSNHYKFPGIDIPVRDIYSFNEALTQRKGVFVSLYKFRNLRGCIGQIRPGKPLYLAVNDAALNAALKDSRFPPVSERELDDIKIEISVLSPLKIIRGIDEIQIGKTGLYIVKGNNSGLLLPQVPVQFGWGRKEFLEQVSAKAGLDKNAWKDKDSVLYGFTAEVFQE